MSYRVAPAARALLDQATARAPQRNKASDGLAGDVRHAQESPKSWHLPRSRSMAEGSPTAPDGSRWARDPDGLVFAVDLTHDPKAGIDAHALAREVVRRDDRRVAEVITDGTIWTRRRAAEGFRPYDGSNPHTRHAHITVDPRYADDTSPWWPEETEMTPEQAAKLDRLVTQVGDLLARVTGLQQNVDRIRVKLWELDDDAITTLSDADFARIKKDVNDEAARRGVE